MSVFEFLDTSFNQINQQDEIMNDVVQNKFQEQNIEGMGISIIMVIQNCLMRNIQSQSLIELVLEDLIPKLNDMLKNYSDKREFIQQPLTDIHMYDIQTPDQNQLQLLDQCNYYKVEEHQIDFQISTQQINSNQRQHRDQKRKSRYEKRGPYKKFTQQQKEDLIQLIESDKNNLNVEINRSNIRRWQQFGTNKKSGQGRKPIDTNIQTNLYNWCLQEAFNKERPVTRDMIKLKALELNSQNQNFKASKGWIDNFVKRFKLKQQMHSQIQQIGVYNHEQRQKNKVKKEHQRIKKEQNICEKEESINPSIFFDDDYFL